MTIYLNDLSEADGKEIMPWVFLIGTPGWNEEAQQWRCLANYGGSLCLVELAITGAGHDGDKDRTP